MLRGKATLKESLELLSTTQEEVPLSLKSTSEIPIDISTEPNISLPPRELTPDSIFSVEEKPPSQLATSSPSIKLLREPLFAILNPLLEIRVHTPDALEHMPPLSGTQKTEAEPESDFLQDQERPSPEAAEPPSASSLVEVEMKSLS